MRWEGLQRMIEHIHSSLGSGTEASEDPTK